MDKQQITDMFDLMLNNINIYKALKGYSNFQVDAIKEYLQIHKEFFLRDSEDDIPLPISGEVIKDENAEDDN